MRQLARMLDKTGGIENRSRWQWINRIACRISPDKEIERLSIIVIDTQEPKVGGDSAPRAREPLRPVES